MREFISNIGQCLQEFFNLEFTTLSRRLEMTPPLQFVRLSNNFVYLEPGLNPLVVWNRRSSQFVRFSNNFVHLEPGLTPLVAGAGNRRRTKRFFICCIKHILKPKDMPAEVRQFKHLDGQS